MKDKSIGVLDFLRQRRKGRAERERRPKPPAQQHPAPPNFFQHHHLQSSRPPLHLPSPARRTRRPTNPSSLPPAHGALAARAPGSNPRPSPRARGWISTAPMVIRGELSALNTAPDCGSRAGRKAAPWWPRPGTELLSPVSVFSLRLCPCRPRRSPILLRSWGRVSWWVKLLLPAAPPFGG